MHRFRDNGVRVFFVTEEEEELGILVVGFDLLYLHQPSSSLHSHCQAASQRKYVDPRKDKFGEREVFSGLRLVLVPLLVNL